MSWEALEDANALAGSDTGEFMGGWHHDSLSRKVWISCTVLTFLSACVKAFLSPDGRCKSFDERAGIVVVKYFDTSVNFVQNIDLTS